MSIRIHARLRCANGVACGVQVIGVSDPVEATIECYHRAHRLAIRNRDIG